MKRELMINFQLVLVSFCNIPEPTTSPILCVKIPLTEKYPIEYVSVDIGYPGLIHHVTGITLTNDKILVAFSASDKFFLAGLSKYDLTPLFYQELPDASDVHSILALGDHLYIVSTGTDEVLVYDILQTRVANPQVFWYATLEKKDTQHINSIVENNGEIFISAFGIKVGNLWASASNGYIHNISYNIRIKEGIYQPHSLSSRNGKLYYCESHKGTFCSLDHPILNLPGYTRGVSWLSDDRICLTTSIGRKISRNTGQIGNPGDSGKPVGQCSLTVQSIKNKKRLAMIDLSWFGPEIYDTLVLPQQQIDLLKTATLAQMAERRIIQTLLDQANENIKTIEKLKLQSGKNEQSLQTISSQITKQIQEIEVLSSQLAEKEQTIYIISSQITLQNQEIETLSTQLAKKEQTLQLLSSQITLQNQEIETLSTQLAKKEQTLQLFSSQISQQNQEIETFATHLAEKEQTVQTLSEQITEEKQAIQMLLSHLAEKDKIILEIVSSRGWQLLIFLWGIRIRLIPHSGFIERMVRKSVRALKIWRHLGGYTLLRKAFNKISIQKKKRVTTKNEIYNQKHLHQQEFISNKPDIFCFPIIDWHFRFQRPQQILSEFSKHDYRIFYLDTKFYDKESDWFEISPIHKQIHKLSLPGDININIYLNSPTIETFQLTKIALINFIQQQNIHEAICLVQHPFWLLLAEFLKKNYGWKVIYDCMDDHSAFLTTNQDINKLEAALIVISDLVITSSNILYNKLSLKHPNCILVQNAADYDHFNQLPHRYASPLSKLPRPIIGYYGAIAEWFDTESVYQAALSHPEWSFMLIGHTFGAEIKALNKLSNVHFLGEKPYSTLPSYLAGFDVCTIPFLRTPLTEATNPVKVYEYLSTGKPIVARNLPELESLSNSIYLYNTPNEFLNLLEQAISDDTAHNFEIRQAIARQNTWQMRYQSMESSIDKLYEKTSIIIVTWNNLEFTQRCIQSILADKIWPNYEIIIVDNASTDGTVEYLTSLSTQESRVRTFYNNKNLGFAAANNIGLNHTSDSKFIVLLNNDTIVPCGWLARLIRHLRKPDIGMVGPVTNFAGNEAKIDVPYNDIKDMEVFALSYISKHDGIIFDIRMLAMYCVAMRKEIFDKIGPLDERFGIGMFEDDDYCNRIRQAGYRIVCAEDVYVHHHGRASINKLTEHSYWNLFEMNKRLYEDKWQEAWVPHKYRGE